MNLSKFLTGVVILGIGLLLLLLNFGYIDSGALLNLWKYWPVIIIVIGCSILFKAMPKPLEIFFNLVLSLVLIFGLFFVIREAIISKESKTFSQKAIDRQLAEPFNEEAQRAQIDINTGAATVNIAGGSNLLLEGTIESVFGSPIVSRQFIAQDKTDAIKISQSSRIRTGNWNGKSQNNWAIKINDDIKTKLSINSGASKITPDLTNTMVDEFNLDTGASKIELSLGSRPDKISGSIKAGASTIVVRLPKNSGLKIHLDAGLTKNNFGQQGLSENDKIYTTTDFDQSSKKIELNISAGASTIDLQRY